ncbi:universal stress protein [Streptomyces solincola]|uniref:Universal stress protein n=1 Tax=Streptomyces solincola TaxID=2100817 RepID=A0A2S9Q278_9ACTN|nr:universal stress protein [Streptomyces solincola]PRH80774.1 universal stress protein [Streptomyces solincola]
MTASPLVVGVDGSPSSYTAADWAVDEALRRDVPLRIVHASSWERYEGPHLAAGLERTGGRVLAENIVGAAAQRAVRRAPGVTVRTAVRAEDPAGALVRESEHAFAVVTGCRGRGDIAGLLLGSVSLTVAATAHCPVVVVRGSPDAVAGGRRRVAAGVGAAEDGEAVGFACEEAEARGCPLEVVHAWRDAGPRPAEHPLLTGGGLNRRASDAEALLETVIKGPLADHPDLEARCEVEEGSARKTLLRRATRSDLLVIGGHRRHGRLGMQLGLVGHALLHHADCPVALVPRRA